MEALLLVLVDFLEVLVGIHLQLAAGSFVTGNDAIGMQLQSADGPGMIHAAFHTVAQGTGLVVTADQQQNLLGIADSANTIAWGVPEEEAVRAASYNPAKALGVLDQVGSIETGKLADFIITNADYSAKRVFIGGKEL